MVSTSYVSASSGSCLLYTSIAAGNAPDFVLCSSGYYAPYVEAGSFQDVSDFYELPEVNADDFDKNVVDLLYYDDLCVGVPMQMVSHYFYWDKDLYEAAGLDPDCLLYTSRCV